jgi:DNA-binding response OmpR family regulator
MNVLVAEDDPNIRSGLKDLLEGEGYSVTACADGAAALQSFAATKFDFVLLDIMMPKASGYDVCRKIRAEDAAIPIVFLSAKSEEIDKVVGLELGADDYIMKPFGTRELLARVRAISRRALSARSERKQASFKLADLQVHPDRLQAERGKIPIDLSLRETRILQLFFERLGEALDRDTIIDRCWGDAHFPNSRTLDQAIAVLRKKIELDVRAPTIIKTVHGIGYRVDP